MIETKMVEIKELGVEGVREKGNARETENQSCFVHENDKEKGVVARVESLQMAFLIHPAVHFRQANEGGEKNKKKIDCLLHILSLLKRFWTTHKKTVPSSSPRKV